MLANSKKINADVISKFFIEKIFLSLFLTLIYSIIIKIYNYDKKVINNIIYNIGQLKAINHNYLILNICPTIYRKLNKIACSIILTMSKELRKMEVHEKCNKMLSFYVKSHNNSYKHELPDSVFYKDIEKKLKTEITNSIIFTITEELKLLAMSRELNEVVIYDEYIKLLFFYIKLQDKSGEYKLPDNIIFKGIKEKLKKDIPTIIEIENNQKRLKDILYDLYVKTSKLLIDYFSAFFKTVSYIFSFILIKKDISSIIDYTPRYSIDNPLKKLNSINEL